MSSRRRERKRESHGCCYLIDEEEMEKKRIEKKEILKKMRGERVRNVWKEQEITKNVKKKKRKMKDEMEE